jgi:hypothetical protein
VHIHDNVPIVPITNPLQVLADDNTLLHHQISQNEPEIYNFGENSAANDDSMVRTHSQEDLSENLLQSDISAPSSASDRTQRSTSFFFF